MKYIHKNVHRILKKKRQQEVKPTYWTAISRDNGSLEVNIIIFVCVLSFLQDSSGQTVVFLNMYSCHNLCCMVLLNCLHKTKYQTLKLTVYLPK